MALKIKAREKKLKFSQDGPEVWRYVMQPDLYSTLDSEKVIKEAAIRSGVSEGVMQACWKGAGEVIKAWATEGHSVALPGLGNMRFGLSAKAVADVNDVKSSLIRTRRIVFTPTVALKDELANTAIQITCYDRNGEIVKRVTSDDAGTVEDPEGDTTGDENTTVARPFRARVTNLKGREHWALSPIFLSSRSRRSLSFGGLILIIRIFFSH